MEGQVKGRENSNQVIDKSKNIRGFRRKQEGENRSQRIGNMKQGKGKAEGGRVQVTVVRGKWGGRQDGGRGGEESKTRKGIWKWKPVEKRNIATEDMERKGGENGEGYC